LVPLGRESYPQDGLEARGLLGGSPGIVVETVFGDTFRFSPNLAIPGFQGLVTFAINMIPGEPLGEASSYDERTMLTVPRIQGIESFIVTVGCKNSSNKDNIVSSQFIRTKP
jgi:hypothetical protein